MTIELISQEQFDFITEVYKKHPILTLQNKGYETIKDKLSEEENKAKNDVSEILSKHIKGYSSFTNFRLSHKENKLQLRFQYDYQADLTDEEKSGSYLGSFIGVGYILLEQLLNGFKEE
jgi:hypothetical protein